MLYQLEKIQLTSEKLNILNLLKMLHFDIRFMLSSLGQFSKEELYKCALLIKFVEVEFCFLKFVEVEFCFLMDATCEDANAVELF